MEPQSKTWVLTKASLDRLLATLHPDRDLAGREYEKIRSKLLKLFQWRGCVSPEDLTDETLNRVAKKVESGEVIRDIQAYVGGVARLVWLESVKAERRKSLTLDQLSQFGTTYETDSAKHRLACFESCLAGLPASSRELIIDYHRKEKRARIELRKQLAKKLGIQLNALRIRAHRIRLELEDCVAKCMRKSSD
ncbi:MAG TPA: hypothetical protein VEW46_15510 [Pyrinomonadaceae bacterium]|nr:hypothetical protein [Pyrinomonadaceae bacterium]